MNLENYYKTEGESYKPSNFMFSKIVGVSFENRQDKIKELKENEELILEREPANQYDKNAIKILNSEREHLGYVNKEIAIDMAKAMDKGLKFKVIVTSITGGKDNNYGCNIKIERVKT